MFYPSTQQRSRQLSPLLVCSILRMLTRASAGQSYSNVYGQPLQSCSSDGMALTGYTRTGYCVDEYDDQGSHHICIDLSSTSNNGDNFCTVTGQSDWCSSQDMPCHNNKDNHSCAVQNWCVCQWAFASYIENAGGCDSIQTIVCDSINLQAILAYQQQIAQEKYANALQCIVDRCSLDMNNLPSTAVSSSQNVWGQASNIVMAAGGRNGSMQTVFLTMIGVGLIALLLAGAAIGTVRRFQSNSRLRKDSNTDANSHLLTDKTPTTAVSTYNIS
ncbi:DUF2064 domain containing protein [Nitzschia inconspicua]|uniref:DUF2064 domain containing protein n=1 Tax=Nitzschia inconspicua TaxID=303405 RepID=A0A9K3LL85_9STRA|nr:DUF2064 domain containing protein [Nitzschia inconspicua]